MLQTADSAELRALIVEDQSTIHRKIRNLVRSAKSEFSNILRPAGDVAIIEIGPSRAANFQHANVQRLLRMYLRFASKNGWKASVLSEQFEGDHLRTVALRIDGDQAFHLLSFDRGDHRFIELGEGRFANKKATTYAEVKVYRPPTPAEFSVRPDDFRITTTKSGGPGGQHVNKTDSAVLATHVPTGLTVRVESERSQHDNRRIAITLLTSRLFEEFEADRRSQMRESRREGRTNEFVAQADARWTRTYDWTADSAQTERILSGDLDSALKPVEEAALIQRMLKLRQAIETGRFDGF